MKTRYIIALASGALALAGCQKDNPDMECIGGNMVVRFTPSIAAVNDDSGLTKSAVDVDEAADTYVLTCEDGPMSLPLSCKVMSGMEAYGASADDAVTRATLHNTTGDNTHKLSEYLTEFQVAAWEGTSGSTPFIPAYTKVKYITGTESYWSTVDDSDNVVEYVWKKSVSAKTFFAHANLPASGASVECTGAASQTLTLTALPDRDILLGFYQGDGSTGSPAEMTGTASIHFYHPMTAVRFKKGTVSDGVSITGISIEGVYTSGKTTQTASTGTDFVWTRTDGSAFARTDEKGTASLSSVTVDDDSFIGDAIVLIPQTFASDTARIVVSLSTPTGSKTLYYLLKGKTFSAGYTNVFTIGYDEYTFTFELTNSSQATQVFLNGSDDSSPAITNITSKKKDLTGETSEGWRIMSYRVGSASPVSVGGDSFNGGGLTVSKEGGSLKITSLSRTSKMVGNHEYWTNEGGISGDTDGTGWSPKDWSTTTATISSPLDLSKFNFKTETSQAMTTANCYIVRHAGTYKIPLVYGNGVVGGNENTRSYKPTLSGNTESLSPLVDHLNEGITSAFIENKAECVPTGCAILWQDEAVVVKDLVITGATAATYNASNVRYLQFTVDPSTICQNNALICIYKDKNGNSKYDSGEAVWSWHIWTTNDPALLDDAIPVTNHSGIVYNFFPIYNIGYVDDLIYYEREQVIITLEQTASGKTTTITVNQPLILEPSQGNYYQFGRKDPMCRKNAPASGAFYIKDASLTDFYVNKAITEPDTFYGCTPYEGTVGWHTWAWPNSNLWSGSKATYNTSYENDSEIFKTIYDPSPVGYKVPASKAFTGFTTTGVETATPSEYNVYYYHNGYFFYTNSSKSDVIYFPASGYRHSQTGVIYDVGGRGSYWAAVSGNNSSGYQMLFYNGNSSGIAPDNFERRANGQSVRPVLE